MPTFETLPGFEAGWRHMTREQQGAFRTIVLDAFNRDLMTPDRSFRPGLRVVPILGCPGLQQMSWSEEGRAAFSLGSERTPDAPHVIWWQITSYADSLPLWPA